MLMRVKQAAEYTGLHPNTIRKYIDKGIIKGIRIGKHRYVDSSELDRLMGRFTKVEDVAIYVRVSTHKQEKSGNLERQKERLLEFCAKNGLKVSYIIEDVASGVNERRRGLSKLIRLARERKISKVVVEY